ncbi:MAG: ABC transporter permease [Gammaproteobacteria bacterium]|nr:ABC transporter permease [Gammaproteobacteria bacterium]MDH3465854.1 ABC transporter permease [Gammaproteobacteria bacterium]
MSELRITIYTPDSLLANPVSMGREMLRDLAASMQLAWRLTVRDLSAQYRQTFLGFFWAIILPLANTLVWIFLSRSGVVNLSDTALPYPVYVFTGTMLWAILMDALNAPLKIVTASKNMLAKINFPRESLVVAGICQTIVNALIKVALLLVALLAMGIYPDWSVLLFPIGLISLILVGTVIGLALTPVGLLYTDVGKAIPLLMQFLMYLTPVVFAMPKSGISATLFQLNPMTPLILTARDWLTGYTPEFLGYFVLVNVVAIILLFLFWIVFRLAMPILIERMGS